MYLDATFAMGGNQSAKTTLQKMFAASAMVQIKEAMARAQENQESKSPTEPLFAPLPEDLRTAEDIKKGHDDYAANMGSEDSATQEHRMSKLKRGSEALGVRDEN